MDQQNEISNILAHHGYIKRVGHCRCGMKLAAHGSQYLRHHQAEMITAKLKGSPDYGDSGSDETRKEIIIELIDTVRELSETKNEFYKVALVDVVARMIGVENEEFDLHSALQLLILRR